MTYPYRIRSPEIWAQARDDYLAGLDAEAVCRRHELGLSAFRRRARKYGWRRQDQPGAPPDVRQALMIYDDLTPNEEVETARLRFVQALERGRAMEAIRWRRLWQEMKAESDLIDALIFPGEEPPEYRLHEVDQPMEDESDAEVRLLSGAEPILIEPPFEDPAFDEPEGEPAPSDPATRENVHDVHSIFAGVHNSDAPRPSKRAARRLRGRAGRQRGGP
ncbi:hypothetical protein [Brevundimonas sp. FT23042]|uniref:hypothetical protein n=1 Tax=Brevundimonas sp. FT23042 TaxID=3393749 RepID=UPI003B588D09